jgi:transposase-like protein
MAVTIAGRRFWLWRAVDDEGEVLDLLVCSDDAIRLRR